LVGPDATRSSLIAEVQVAGEPGQQGKVDARGIHGLYPMGDGVVRVVVTEASLAPAAEPTLDDLKQALVEVFGTDFGVHSPIWLSRFTDATRQAESYRKGPVLLAGDAAHVHSPTGGLGIGLGLQDAVNLGWKLGQVVLGDSGEDLLDTYHAERHPAGARSLKYTMAQSLFQKADPRQEALRDLLDEALRVDAGAMGDSGAACQGNVRRRVAASGAGRGGCPDGSPGQARRLRRLGGRRVSPWAP
jgi:3-(3-hydroxy-phenyl)propionate hydroxylase